MLRSKTNWCQTETSSIKNTGKSILNINSIGLGLRTIGLVVSKLRHWHIIILHHIRFVSPCIKIKWRLHFSGACKWLAELFKIMSYQPTTASCCHVAVNAGRNFQPSNWWKYKWIYFARWIPSFGKITAISWRNKTRLLELHVYTNSSSLPLFTVI